MRTKYESIIETVACAMEDHSYNIAGLHFMMTK